MATAGVNTRTSDDATYKSVCYLILLSTSSMFERAMATRRLTTNLLDEGTSDYSRIVIGN